MKNLNEYINEGLIKRHAGVDVKAKIEAWLNEHRVVGYIINDDLTIDVSVGVDLRNYTEKQLPDYIQFGKVAGYFDFGKSRNLESLKGCPKAVGGCFGCYECSSLKSLEGVPRKVGGSFNCIGCKGDFTPQDVKKVCKVKIIYC